MNGRNFSSAIIALQQAREAIAKLETIARNSPVAIFEAAERMRALELLAAHTTERLNAFDVIAARAAERIRAAIDNAAAAQVFADDTATAAAQKYIHEQAALWERIRNAAVHNREERVVTPTPAAPQLQLDFDDTSPVAPKIQMPPLHWLASILDFFLTKGAFQRTVGPILVDIYDEYYELIDKGDEWRAKWIVARGCGLVIWGQLARPLAAIAGWLSTFRG
jgi:hypothetical protein